MNFCCLLVRAAGRQLTPTSVAAFIACYDDFFPYMLEPTNYKDIANEFWQMHKMFPLHTHLQPKIDPDQRKLFRKYSLRPLWEIDDYMPDLQITSPEQQNTSPKTPRIAKPNPSKIFALLRIFFMRN